MSNTKHESKETAPQLTQSEKALVASYLLMFAEEREGLLLGMLNNPNVSKNLITVLRYLLTV